MPWQRPSAPSWGPLRTRMTGRQASKHPMLRLPPAGPAAAPAAVRAGLALLRMRAARGCRPLRSLLCGLTYRCLHYLSLPADQMLSDAELGGFVEFGSDPDAVLAAQRRLRDQARAAAAASSAGAADAEAEEAPEAGEGKKSRRGRGASRPREQQIPEELLPKVAIVGRPNVGKSGERRKQHAATAGYGPNAASAPIAQIAPVASQCNAMPQPGCSCLACPLFAAAVRRSPFPQLSPLPLLPLLPPAPLKLPRCLQRCSTALWAPRWPLCSTTPV